MLRGYLTSTNSKRVKTLKKYYLVPEIHGGYSAEYSEGSGSKYIRNSYGSKECALKAIEKAKEDDRKAEEYLLWKKNNPPILIED